MTGELVVDLNASRYASAFKADGSLHEKSLRKVRETLERLADRHDLESFQDTASPSFGNKSEEHAHETIAVLGERGSGKTSFILSLANATISGEDLRWKELGKRLHFLPPFEQDQMEDHELPLVTIIARIDESLRDDDRVRAFLLRNETAEAAIERSLSELSSCLPAILPDAYKQALAETVGAGELAGQLLRERAHNSHLLARRFRAFVEEWITILRQSGGRDHLKALVLSIDDIDMRFQNGWWMLETIRRYLAFPKLIVIASGHEDLFHLVVRMKYSAEIKGLLSPHVPPHQIARDLRLLDRTREQYLVKIFPNENRVDLRPANNVIRDMAHNCIIRHGSISPSSSVSNVKLLHLAHLFIARILLHHVSESRSTQRSSDNATRGYRLPDEVHCILTGSLRTALDIMELVLWPLSQDDASDSLSHSSDQHVAQQLLSVFRNEWSSKGLPLQEILDGQRGAEHEFLRAVTNPLFVDNDAGGRIESFYNLTPSYTDTDTNRVAVCALTAFNRLHRVFPYRILFFWLVVTETYLNWEKEDVPDKDALIRFLRIAKGEQPADMIGRYVAWSNARIIANYQANPRAPGVVKLETNREAKYRQRIAKLGGAAAAEAREQWKKLPIARLEEFPIWPDLARLAPVAYSVAAPFVIRVVETRGMRAQHTYACFQRGLGALASIEEEVVRRGEGDNPDATLPQVTRLLRIWMQERVYDSPATNGNSNWESNKDAGKRATSPGVDSEGGEAFTAGEDSEEIDKVASASEVLARKLVHWIAWKTRVRSNNHPIPAGDVLASMWRRLHHNLEVQADPRSFPQGSCTLGRFLRRSTLAFLSALVAEELLSPHPRNDEDRPQPGIRSVDTRNTHDSPLVLLSNLSLVGADNMLAYLPYSLEWIACPWLRAFLSKDDIKKIDAFVTKSVLGQASGRSSEPLYDVLHEGFVVPSVRRSGFRRSSVSAITCYPILCGIPPWILDRTEANRGTSKR